MFPPQPTSGSEAMSFLTSESYSELRRVARSVLNSAPKVKTIDAADLLHEALVRIAGSKYTVRCNDLVHFRAVVAQMMRWVLLDHIRRLMRKPAVKSLEPLLFAFYATQSSDAADLSVETREVLQFLFLRHPRQGLVLYLNALEEMPLREIADRLSLSERTAKRDLRQARTWLQCELSNAYRSKPRSRAGSGRRRS